MTSPADQLESYRSSIDNLDAILLHTLAERSLQGHASRWPPQGRERHAAI